MGFSRPEYWSGLPFLTPGDLPTQGWNPRLLHWQADSLQLHPLGTGALKNSIGDLPPPKLAQPWKQPKCPSTDEWISKMWYNCVQMYASTHMHNGILPCLKMEGDSAIYNMDEL